MIEIRCKRHKFAEADDDRIIILCSRCIAHARITGKWEGRPWDGKPIYHLYDRETLRPIEDSGDVPINERPNRRGDDDDAKRNQNKDPKEVAVNVNVSYRQAQ